MLYLPRLVLVCLLLLLSGRLAAVEMTYKIEGVTDEMQKNIEAWLGNEPATVEKRSGFIATASERSERALEALGYYRSQIKVNIDKTETPWAMLISINPGKPVRVESMEIELLGDAANDPAFATLLNSLPLAEGDVLNHDRYEEVKKRLEDLGLQRGYFDATAIESRVEVNAQSASASIRMQYAGGQRYQFGDIMLDDTLAQMPWLDAMINFSAGDVFDQAVMRRLRADLQQTRFFSTVIVRPMLEVRADGRVPIELGALPVSSHTFEFGVGYSTDTEGRISATWRTPMINNKGHSQETRIEYSPIQPSGRFTYNIPLSNPTKDVLQLSASLEDKEYGDVDSRLKGLRIRREIKYDTLITSYAVRTLNETWNVTGDYRDNSYLLPGFSLSHKFRKGSLVDPEAGFHQVYLLEGGQQDMGSDIDLVRFYSNFRLVIPLAERHRFVSRAEAGIVVIDQDDRGNLSPSLSFFAGGSQSIRGFTYQSIGTEIEVKQDDGTVNKVVIGGDRLFTISGEYQYYFTDTWRGAAFVDFGDAFESDNFSANYGAGFGVHYLTPVGAIRVEIANDVSADNPSWRFHINIGAEF